mmetsp:Transcript_54009/g.158930  ORF Transcript_54009/g.158930 Transcript_54009/m.158930 type:complete len:212 (-) Transcript_54009:2266-2901(-)
MVSVASPRGRTSMPLRKGSSASFTFSMASWISCTFSLPSLTNTSTMTRSRSFLVLARRDVSFSCAALLLSTSFVRDAFSESFALGTCACRLLVEAFRAVINAGEAVPISLTASSVAVSRPRPASMGLPRAWRRSTSASVFLMASSSLSRTSLALMSLSASCAAFVDLAMSVWAALRRPCSLPSSVADSLPFAAPASFCLLPITFRASRQAA